MAEVFPTIDEVPLSTEFHYRPDMTVNTVNHNVSPKGNCDADPVCCISCLLLAPV